MKDTKFYSSMGEYAKDNCKGVNRYGDPVYKRQIVEVKVNRYGDPVRVYAKKKKSRC